MREWPLGVFSSIDNGLGVPPEVAHELSIPTVHLHAPRKEMQSQSKALEIRQRLDDLDLEVTCVFAGFDGESYADISTVQRTVGLVPLVTRAERITEFRKISDFAAMLQVRAVGIHLGFIPDSSRNADYQKLLEATRELCQYCAANSQAIHLETGQETAESLVQFIERVECDNLFINFDPANMIMYGCGEPILALREVGKYVRSVHCKDATWSDQPGKTWGNETLLNRGAVDFKCFLETLESLGYVGPLTIESEISQDPERHKAEIAHAADVLRSLSQEVLGS